MCYYALVKKNEIIVAASNKIRIIKIRNLENRQNTQSMLGSQIEANLGEDPFDLSPGPRNDRMNPDSTI